MILEGNLGAFPFEDILKYVRDRQQSGTLEVQGRAGSRRLSFERGRLVFLCHFQDFTWLGRGLLGAGIIDREDYYHLLDETDGDSSEALRRLATTRSQEMNQRLPDVLSAALDDEVLLLSRTHDGGFQFAAEVSEVPEPLRLDVPADTVLSRCEELLTAWNAVARRHPEIESGVFCTESIRERAFHDVRLSAMEWSVLAAINGRRNAADLVSYTGLGHWQILQALDRLLEQSLVHARKEDTDYSFPALVLEEEGAAKSNGGTGRSWLLFRTAEEEKGPLSGPEALALFCNRLLEKLGEGEDADWLPRTWSRLVSRYPLADMVVVNHRRVYVGRFARLRERFAGGEAENAALEETERALAALAQGARERLTQQLGARKAAGQFAKLHSTTLVGERSPLTATRLAQLGLPAPAAAGKS